MRQRNASTYPKADLALRAISLSSRPLRPIERMEKSTPAAFATILASVHRRLLRAIRVRQERGRLKFAKPTFTARISLDQNGTGGRPAPRHGNLGRGKTERR